MELMSKTIGQCLKEQMKTNGEAIAMEAQECSWSFQQLDRITDRMILKLEKMGITYGTHVGIWSVNTPVWVALFLALVKMGAVPVLVNTCYKSEELKGVLDYADVEILFYGTRYKTLVYKDMIEEMKKDTLKVLRYVSMDSFDDLTDNGGLSAEEWEMSDKAISRVRAEAPACMIFTSGTTSQPKGVMLSHYNLINNSAAMVERMRWTSEDKMCITVPLFHCFGITSGIVACILGGISMYLIPYFKTANVWEAIQNANCTILNGVPSMFLALIRKKEYDGLTAKTLKSGIIAGSPVTKDEFLEICERFPDMYLQPAYGQTETSPCVTLTDWNQTNEEKAVSAGTPLEHVMVRIVDSVSNKVLGVNECGEIQVRGYNVMLGYYNLPTETEKTILPDGWLRTGDLGYIDENGELHITGRLKEIIIRAGENISPLEIEMVIRRISWVADIKVIGIPAEVKQEEIAACIIPKDGYHVRADEVREVVGAALAHYKVPEFVLEFEEFPFNASGKIHTNVLKKQAMNRILQKF